MPCKTVNKEVFDNMTPNAQALCAGGERFHEGFITGFKKNNHAETLKEVCSTGEFNIVWSDKAQDQLSAPTFEAVAAHFAATWGMMLSEIVWDPSIIVEPTEQADADGSGKVTLIGKNTITLCPCNDKGEPLSKDLETNTVVNNLCFELQFQDGTCTQWGATWNNGEEAMVKAQIKAMTVALADVPEDKRPAMPVFNQVDVTEEHLRAFAADFLEKFKSGFAENNHEEKMRDVVAEKMTWQWADGFSSKDTEGNCGLIFDQFKNTWGAMVSEFAFPEGETVVADVDNMVIVMGGANSINITGPASTTDGILVNNALTFTLGVEADADGKLRCNRWDGSWDQHYAPMHAALAAKSPAPASA